jgi:hypothetical protein
MEKNIGQNAKYKGDGWMAKVLERIYGHKLLSIFLPLVLWAVILLLELAFSEAPDQKVLQSLIISVFIYPGMLLVLGFQMINPFCKPNIMDFAVLFFTVPFGLYGLFGLAQLLFYLKDGLASGYAPCWAIISAIALIQSKRK